jgi:lysozyme family protein
MDLEEARAYGRATMTERTLRQNDDWTVEGNAIAGRGEARVIFRGLQADLNLFADRAGYAAVAIDGLVGDATVAAARALVGNPTLAGFASKPFPSLDTKELVAEHAPAFRRWLRDVAGPAMNVATERAYERGDGKDWNVKGSIAYGAGPVHVDFQALQHDLNRFSEIAKFAPLEVDGFIGPKTADAVTRVYRTVVVANPLYAATPFPPPDSKEEAAEYCAFIRKWLRDVAKPAILLESGD